MTTDSWQNLGNYSILDRYPYPYFVFTEKQFNVTSKRFDILELDPADYTAIKFCARHESNNGNIDDHALDDIYEDLTSDGAGVYHYVWASDDLVKAGRWQVRLEFEKTSGEKFHHKQTFYFDVEHKMPGKFGDL